MASAGQGERGALAFAHPTGDTLRATMKDGWEHDIFEREKKNPTRSTTRMSSPGIMPASVFTAHAINCLVGRVQRENYKSGTSCQTDTTRFGSSKAQFQSRCCPDVCGRQGERREELLQQSPSSDTLPSPMSVWQNTLFGCELPHYNRRPKVLRLMNFPNRTQNNSVRSEVCSPRTHQHCWGVTSYM